MAWVRSEQSLRDHPKTKRAARALGLKPIHLCGHLHGLWWWALDYAQDGDVTKYEAWELAEAAEFDGDPAAFVEVLVSVGFLERTKTALVIHDWYEYAGVLIEQRKLQANRARRKRDLYSQSDLTREVKARDGNRCRYCAAEVNWADRKGPLGGTYDHIDPEGENTPENLVVACRSCNSRKARRTPADADMVLRPAVNLPAIYPVSVSGPLDVTNERTNVTNEENARARSAPVDNSGKKGRKGAPEAIGNVMQTLATMGMIPGAKP